MSDDQRSEPALSDAELVEQLRATLAMKDHLLQMVSHELRTPLVSITNFSSTMIDAWHAIPEPDKLEYLSTINTQARRLSRLVNDLLAVARMESGRLRTVREDVDLRLVAEETVSEIGPRDEGLVVSVPEGLHVTADRDHVKQILVNYVSNAKKYGEPPIVIEAEEREGGVRLWVADRGAGIPSEFESQLFEKFAQADEAHEKTGSGLGLTIVQGLAHAQGGEAWYERADEGTRFGVSLPRG